MQPCRAQENRWHYCRRIPVDLRKLHIDRKTGKPKELIYLSLETDDKASARKRADA